MPAPTEYVGVGLLMSMVKVPVRMPVGPGRTPMVIDFRVPAVRVEVLHWKPTNDNATEG